MKAAGEKRKSADTKREPATKEELEMKERVEEYNVRTDFISFICIVRFSNLRNWENKK